MTPSFERSTALQARLHEVVPGGAHTFAKGSDQYPEGMAPVLVRGHGARVWDVDGNEFVEFGMGMRAVTLGHGYAPVLDAVRAALLDGVSFTRPTELELAAAEDFLRVVPGADMVKFCKNASDATSAALRLARAATGREVVAMCRDQPYFASQDWFVGTLPMSTGVPAAVRSLVRTFPYNDLAALQAVLEAEPVACVILEAASALAEPAPGFLEGMRALCDRHGTVLILDETITGFRWSVGGAQSVYGVTPDLSTWGKAMGNGFSVAALAGRRDLMELGGLRTDRPRAFLLSSTNGAETTGLAAFRAVVRAYTDRSLGPDPVAVMERQGRALAEGVNAAAAEAGIGKYLSVLGRPSCQIFRTADATGAPSQAMRTLFLQEILRRGVLGQSFVISAAHTDADVEQTVEAARAAIVTYRKALETGRPEELFTGRPVAPAHRLMAEPRRLGLIGPAVPPTRSPDLTPGRRVRPLPASPR
ncbi:MAG: glutamate-1-semialdehyde 2,1-aminomutase [Pseudonocardia sp.]